MFCLGTLHGISGLTWSPSLEVSAGVPFPCWIPEKYKAADPLQPKFGALTCKKWKEHHCRVDLQRTSLAVQPFVKFRLRGSQEEQAARLHGLRASAPALPRGSEAELPARACQSPWLQPVVSLTDRHSVGETWACGHVVVPAHCCPTGFSVRTDLVAVTTPSELALVCCHGESK